MKKKLAVAVVYGGKSGEHEVSLESAASVINAMDTELFDIIPVGIDKTGEWYLNRLSEVFVDNAKVIAVKGEHSRLIPVPNYAKVDGSLRCDVIFPVVHGPLYEDGALQGILQLAEIPYVGCGVLASAMAMDKDITRRLLQHAEIPTVKSVVLRFAEWNANQQKCLDHIFTTLSLPIFVKPARLGSSVGTTKITDRAQLSKVIESVFQYDSKLSIEQGIAAREIELSVLENTQYGQEPLVSIPGEIKVGKKHDFYSYEAKYIDPDGAELIIPASLTQKQIQQFQTYAKKAFTLLEGEGMARVDFFLDKETGEIYLNELNTIPGFTAISMYPKLWQASGLPYSELLTTLIQLAVARHERELKIVRDWRIETAICGQS